MLIKKKKILLGLLAVLAVVGGVAAMSAFEAHVINVTAHIENALSVTPKEIAFGTVFPQEKLYEYLTIEMSDSFFNEDRVDDIEYVIKQKAKPKNPDDPEIPEPFETWHEYCAATLYDPENCYHLLCPYLSKEPDGVNDRGESVSNDTGLASYHDPSAMAYGRLAKLEFDTSDTWTIDLDVPCFEGQCAQDWTHQGWELPGELESEAFGCDLWIEVTGISETLKGSECEPGIVYPCDTGLLGICVQGTKTCDSSGYWGECIGSEPTAEVCDDGLDNDCDGLADYDDADCTYPEPEIEGCTDSGALNYNPEATIDDGTCTYPEPGIEGCTDSGALNYDPEATIDDGTCTYPEPEIEGCTDSGALNYNPEATIDDGTCTYPEPISTDTGWKSPTATGGTYNDWVTAMEAYDSDDVYASTDTAGKQQSYETFEFGIPADSTINGIEVSLEHYEVDVSEIAYIDVAWYCTSDSAWSTTKDVPFRAVETTDTVGGAADLWGRTPIDTDFSDANFILRINSVVNDSPKYLDHIQVKVYYTK